MKKLLIGIIGLVVVLVAAVLIGPSFVDWNAYKAEIAAQAKAATGRTLTIDGDISLQVLPSPALVVNDVSLANLEGASTPQMARLRSLQVRVALGPLLGGNFQVETLQLIDPVIELEVLADGRANWAFETPPSPSSKTAGAPATTDAARPATDNEGGLAPAVRVDSFVIVNGTVVYRDMRSGTEERIEDLNARVAAASLSGPFESSGHVRLRGFPLGYDLDIGQVIHGRTVPFGLAVDVAAGAASVKLAGTIVNLAAAPKLKGKVKVEGINLAGAINTAASIGALPGFLGQAFAAEGTVVASAEGAQIKDLALRLGETAATGSIIVGLGEKTTAATKIAFNHVDLDNLLALPPDEGLAAIAGARKKRDDESDTGSGTAVPASSEIKRGASAGQNTAGEGGGGFVPPANLSATLDISVDAVTYRGDLLRQVQASAEMNGGEITISQLSTQFPGSSEVAVFGFIEAVDGAPRFEGEVEATVSDLRRVMSWLGIDPPPAPADRLRKLTLSSRIKASPKQVEVSDLNLTVDSSRLSGAVTLALRKRLAFGANLAIDRLNLDAYLPAPGAAGATAPQKKTASAKTETAKSTASDQKSAAAPGEPEAQLKAAVGALQVLTTLDANLVVRVDTLVYNRTPVKQAVFDGTLFNGDLQIRSASIKNLAGASAKLNGTVKGLAGLPEMKGIAVQVSANDTSRLFRLLGIEPPIPPKSIGKVALTGKIDGSLLKPRVNATLGAAGGRLDVTGSVSPLSPGLDLKIKFGHPNFSDLMRRLAVDYRPGGKVGAVVVSSRVRGGQTNLTLSEIAGQIGAITVAGGATVDVGGPKPVLRLDLTTGPIIVDPFLPAKRTAALESPIRRALRSLVVPASWRPTAPPRLPSMATKVAGRWPTDAIDLSVLRDFEGAFKINAESLTFDRYTVSQAEVVSSLAGGILHTERLGGALFGGRFDSTSTVTADSKVDAAMVLKDIDVGKVSAAAGKGEVQGTLNMNLDLATTGKNVAAMVQALGGRGKLSLKGMEGEASMDGVPIVGGVLEAVLSLPRVIGGTLSGLLRQFGINLGGAGDDLRSGRADVTGSFAIQRGRVAYNDLQMVARNYSLTGVGEADLPAWTQKMKGNLRLSPAVLKKIKELPADIPFSLEGPLDKSPKVRIDVKRLAIGALTKIPGVDKLEKKLPGVGGLLKGLLGGGSPQPAPQSGNEPPPPPSSTEPPPPQSAPPPPEKKKSIDARDLLKGIFKIK